VHWIVPTIAGALLATSLLLIFVGYLNYLVDTYLMYAASAIAANTIARSACGAAAPLFTNQMFDALGVGGGGSLIGGVAALLAIIPFTFYRYGKAIRVRSKFAPTNIRPKKQPDEERGPTISLTDQATRQGSRGASGEIGAAADATDSSSTRGLETDDGPSGSGMEKKEETV
jgi:MFS transporter, DHA1 family, multidrug resistance protein